MLARRAEQFWDRVKQGVVVLTDIPLYLRTVASWQGAAWLLRFGAFFFFLEAFNIGGSFENVLTVMSVQAITGLLPLTPGGAGAQQALLVATLVGPGPIAVLTYSVGQQIAIAVWTAILGFIALALIFRTTDWRDPDPLGRGGHGHGGPRRAEEGRQGGASAGVAAGDRPAPGWFLGRGEAEVVAARQRLERDQRWDVVEIEADGAGLAISSAPASRTSRSQPSVGR